MKPELLAKPTSSKEASKLFNELKMVKTAHNIHQEIRLHILSDSLL